MLALGLLAVGSTGCTPPTVLSGDDDTTALWPFDEGEGTIVKDIVGDDDLTMDGATWEATGPGCE